MHYVYEHTYTYRTCWQLRYSFPQYIFEDMSSVKWQPMPRKYFRNSTYATNRQLSVLFLFHSKVMARKTRIWRQVSNPKPVYVTSQSQQPTKPIPPPLKKGP